MIRNLLIWMNFNLNVFCSHNRLEDQGVQEQGRPEGEAHPVALGPVLCWPEGGPGAYGGQPGRTFKIVVQMDGINM